MVVRKTRHRNLERGRRIDQELVVEVGLMEVIIRMERVRDMINDSSRYNMMDGHERHQQDPFMSKL